MNSQIKINQKDSEYDLDQELEDALTMQSTPLLRRSDREAFFAQDNKSYQMIMEIDSESSDESE